MMMSARQVAAALRGKVAGRNKVTAPGPGHSPQDQSLLVSLDPTAPEGFSVHSFAGDDWRECRDYVRRKLGLPEWQPGDEQDRRVPASRIKQWDADTTEAEMGPRPRTEEDLARIKLAQDLWNDAGEPRGTLVETYLREHRCLELTAELAGPVLRFHPRTPWRDENTGKTIRVPAMIAAFRSIDDDEITAVHRIRLDPDTADKIDRRMLGIVHRAAVKLDPTPPDDKLVIGEGIETGMAARECKLTPVWALGSVSAISWFPIIDGVRKLYLLSEPGEASKQAITLCNRRWRRAARRTYTVVPSTGDLNDALIAERGVKHG
jgi:putative DNA primase/helicase